MRPPRLTQNRPVLVACLLAMAGVVAADMLTPTDSNLAVAYVVVVLLVVRAAGRRTTVPVCVLGSVATLVPLATAPAAVGSAVVAERLITVLTLWAAGAAAHGWRRAQEKFVRLVEETPVAMLMVDEGGRVVLSNAGAEDMLGYSRHELAGMHVDRLVPESLRGEHPAHRAAFHSSPSARPMGKGHNLSVRRRDGTEAPVEIGLNPIHTGEGMRVVVSILDVSERRRYEARQQRDAAELARKNRELEQFAYSASHDLRDPLQKVVAFGDLLVEDYAAELSSGARDCVVRMQKSARRMRELIDGLLEFATVSREEIEREAVDLGRVVDGVLGDLETKISERGAVIEIGPLPVVPASRILMRQLFQNLVANALKFQRPGEVPRIHIDTVDAGPDAYDVRIKDNGVGFSLDLSERLFRPFERLHGRSEFEGAGMGLAICHKIVFRHGWSLVADSEPGKGSTFTIQIRTRTPSPVVV